MSGRAIRRIRRPSSDRSELALRLALESAAGIAFASFLLVHAIHAPPSSGLGRSLAYWGCAGALILLPLVLPSVPGPWQPRGPVRVRGHRSSTLLLLLSAIPLVPLRAERPMHMLLAVLVVAQAHLLVRWRDDRAAAWNLVLSPIAVLTGMAAAPGRPWLFALPVAVLIVATGAVLLHDRHTRAEVEARAPRVFVSRWRELRTDRDSFRGLWRRLLCVLPISVSVLLAAAVLYPLLAGIPEPPYHHPERTPAPSGSGGGTGGGGGATQRQAFEHIFPTELRPGSALSTLEFQQVMTIRALTDSEGAGQAKGEDLGQLYMRGICMDTFTETGLRLARGREPTLHRDHEDGRRNGWTVLDPLPRSAMVRLDIRQQRMAVQGGARSILFASYPLHAISAPAVWYDPDGMLQLATEEEGPEFEYSLLVSFLEPRSLGLESRRARHGDPQFLQLPRASAELDWVTTRAEGLMRDATNDLSRLEAVLDHFRAEYRYSIRTGDVPGLEGIVGFMRRRMGHCTSFAAAAVLLLRTQGISARVATGLLAGDYSEETGLYTVTTKNGHAWIEVWFDGVGWVTFDPTPPRARRAALAAAEEGLDEGFSAWFDELQSDLRAWAESGADRAYLAILLDTAADAPVAFWVTLQRKPWIGVLLVLLVALPIWLRLRRRRGGEAQPYPRRRTRDETLIEKLLAALAVSGHRRRPGQTLAEVAGEVREDGEELVQLVGELYGVRFGGAPLEREVAERVERWISRRRRMVEATAS